MLQFLLAQHSAWFAEHEAFTSAPVAGPVRVVLPFADPQHMSKALLESLYTGLLNVVDTVNDPAGPARLLGVWWMASELRMAAVKTEIVNNIDNLTMVNQDLLFNLLDACLHAPYRDHPDMGPSLTLFVMQHAARVHFAGVLGDLFNWAVWSRVPFAWVSKAIDDFGAYTAEFPDSPPFCDLTRAFLLLASPGRVGDTWTAAEKERMKTEVCLAHVSEAALMRLVCDLKVIDSGVAFEALMWQRLLLNSAPDGWTQYLSRNQGVPWITASDVNQFKSCPLSITMWGGRALESFRRFCRPSVLFTAEFRRASMTTWTFSACLLSKLPALVPNGLPSATVPTSAEAPGQNPSPPVRHGPVTRCADPQCLLSQTLTLSAVHEGLRYDYVCLELEVHPPVSDVQYRLSDLVFTRLTSLRLHAGGKVTQLLDGTYWPWHHATNSDRNTVTFYSDFAVPSTDAITAIDYELSMPYMLRGFAAPFVVQSCRCFVTAKVYARPTCKSTVAVQLAHLGARVQEHLFDYLDDDKK